MTNPTDNLDDELRGLLWVEKLFSDMQRRGMWDDLKFLRLCAIAVALELEGNPGLDPELRAWIRDLRETNPQELENARDAAAVMRSWMATEGEDAETLPPPWRNDPL